MRKYDYTEQLRMPFVDVVKEEKQEPAKRVNIVSVKLVKEKSMLYKNRRVRSPQDAHEIIHEYLGNVDREHFI